MTDPTEQSSSVVRQHAESVIREAPEHQLGVGLEPKRLALGQGFVEVDGAAPGEAVLVEIYAHVGELKGGHRHKVRGDVLKLATLGRARPASQLIIAFCDDEAAAGVAGWLAYACEAFGIEKRVVPIPAEIHAGLEEAQARQRMVNPDVEPEGGE